MTKRTRTGCIFYFLKAIEADFMVRANWEPRALRSTWLLKYRANFRWVISFGRIEPIKLYIADCPPAMLPLALWLWGRCADRFRLYGLSAFIRDPSPVVRKHVAKALRRLEAWSLLNEMAAAYPDEEKVQWFATAKTTHRVFADRLKNFTSGIDQSRTSETRTISQMPFWSKDKSWERTSPKSVLLIGRILVRIRRRVRFAVG